MSLMRVLVTIYMIQGTSSLPLIPSNIQDDRVGSQVCLGSACIRYPAFGNTLSSCHPNTRRVAQPSPRSPLVSFLFSPSRGLEDLDLKMRSALRLASDLHYFRMVQDRTVSRRGRVCAVSIELVSSGINVIDTIGE